jgi:hypothetical protein
VQQKEFMEDLLLFFCQRLYVFFWHGKSVVEMSNHASKSPSCVLKSKANDSTCHPFIDG